MNIPQMSMETKPDPIFSIVFNLNSIVSLFSHNLLKSKDDIFLQGHANKDFKNIRALEVIGSLCGQVKISSQVPT